MKTPGSILVILDKPKHEQTALEHARTLQVASGAGLHLVSFLWHSMAEQKDVFDASQRRALKNEMLRNREAWLRDLIRDAGLSAATVTTEVVWTSDIAAWVEQHASASDLMVKTAHRSRSLLHTPLDWELLHVCCRPLLFVGKSGLGGRRKPTADVIATLDLRNNDRRHRTLNLRVLDAANRFAELRGGKLHCVAVVEYSEVLSDLEFINPRKVQRETVTATRDLLDSMIAPYPIAQSRVHRPAGKVGHLVAATARKTSAGMVVVGSAARRGGAGSVSARLLGGSAEKIIDRSPVDVLVVHP